MARTVFCPKGKMLAGSWFCPCHGLARTASGAISKSGPQNARAGGKGRAATRSGPWEGLAARREREADEISAGLLAVLERIRAAQLRRWQRNELYVSP